MKTFLTTVLFFFGLNFTFSQSDDDFALAATSKDGTDYYVYVEKTNDDESKALWIRHTTAVKSFRNKKGKNVTTGGEKTLIFINLNCREREFDMLQRVVYNPNGKLIHHDQDYDMSNKIIPGSVMSGICEFVCSE